MGRVMQVSQDSPTPEALDAATKVLEAGGILALGLMLFYLKS